MAYYKKLVSGGIQVVDEKGNLQNPSDFQAKGINVATISDLPTYTPTTPAPTTPAPITPTPITPMPTILSPGYEVAPAAPLPSFVPAEGKFYQETGGPKVYQYKGGKLSHIASPEAARALGVVPKTGEAGWVNVEYINPAQLAGIPQGEEITGEVKPPPEVKPEPRKAWGEIAQGKEEELKKKEGLSETETKIEEASNKIKTFLETTPNSMADFQNAYDTAGLGETKGKIATLDSNIDSAKVALTQALTDASGKRIPQWMITGRKRIEVDKANATIGNLIDQRNGLATQYNTGLNEVTVKVGLKQEDTKQEALNLQSLLDLATGEYDRVQARIAELLRGEKEAYEGETARLLESVTKQEAAKAEEKATAKEEKKKIEDLMAKYPGAYIEPTDSFKDATRKVDEYLKLTNKEIITIGDSSYEYNIATGEKKLIGTAPKTTGGKSVQEMFAEDVAAGMSLPEALASYSVFIDPKRIYSTYGVTPPAEGGGGIGIPGLGGEEPTGYSPGTNADTIIKNWKAGKITADNITPEAYQTILNYLAMKGEKISAK